MECSRHDRLPARREVEKEKKGEKGRDHIRALWFAEARESSQIGVWLVVPLRNSENKSGAFAGCGCWLLCLLVQKYLPVMGNGQ